jgi:hypothetical protein
MYSSICKEILSLFIPIISGGSHFKHAQYTIFCIITLKHKTLFFCSSFFHLLQACQQETADRMRWSELCTDALLYFDAYAILISFSLLLHVAPKKTYDIN